MNWKTILGMAISSLLTLNSCQKEDIIYIPLDGDKDASYSKKELVNPEMNMLHDFGELATKTRVVPTWIEGDLISVYSISEENTVLFIDTCAVYDVKPESQNLGRITAEVAKECLGYFAVYPFDHFDYKVGDEIEFSEDRNFGGHADISKYRNCSEGKFGKFGYMSLMTAWHPHLSDDTLTGYLNFHNRLALLKVYGFKNSDFPMHVVINYKDRTAYETQNIKNFTDAEMYIPIAAENMEIPSIFVYYHSNSGNKYKALYPKEETKIGHIYPVGIK